MPAEDRLAALVSEEWGRLVALLLARYRRLDLVEDALADAVEAAARTWPRSGVPDNPAAWLHRTARRRVLDRLRAEAVRRRRTPLLITDALHRADHGEQAPDPARTVDPDRPDDDLLRLVLMCSHPALDPAGASALCLRLVLGVSTHDIARLFLVSEPTMAARLTRAKRKIVGAGIPFAMPGLTALPDRLEAVARTAYLAFTAGYAPGSGPDLVRAELAGEAVRLVRVVRGLQPDEPVLTALLALMLLQHSRRDSRTDDAGELVLLADQDRSRWRQQEIEEGLRLLTSPRLTGPLSLLTASYLLQARIAAEHARATDAAATRWPVILAHYDALLRLDPNPGARLARAVALAEVEGPRAGLTALAEVRLPDSHRVETVRAELLARSGEREAAVRAFEEAIALCRNDVERAHLARRREELLPPKEAR